MEKKFKIFVIAAIVLLGVGVGAAIFLLVGMQQEPEQVIIVQEAGEVPPEELELLPLPDKITANLALGADQMPHIVVMTISFRIHNQADDYDTFMERFATDQVIVKDHIIGVLRSKTYDDLNQPGAKENLAELLAEELNTLFETQLIKEVYFGELFIQ